MPTRDELCQQEQEHYKNFHNNLHNLGADPSTANASYLSSIKFKEPFDKEAQKMMKAESGDELNSAFNNIKKMADHQLDKGRITQQEHKQILEPLEKLKESRGEYLSKPFNKESHWKGRAWVLAGTAIITTALALTVIGAPLIPAAVLGGAALAYGIADQAKELADHVKDSSDEKLAGMHHSSFDDFKKGLDDAVKPQSQISKEPTAKVTQSQATPNSKTQPKSKSSISSKLKTVGKILGIAGLGLAAAALIAVFPPLGIPLAAGIAIGVISTGVIIGAGAVAGAQYYHASKENKEFISENDEQHKEQLKNLNEHFDETQKQSKVKPPSNDDELPKAKPPKNELPKAEPPKDEPPKAEPPKDEPPKDEPPKDEPPKDEPPKDEPPKEEPPKDEPPKDEPPKDEPPKDEPPKDEPPKDEPPKAEPHIKPHIEAIIQTPVPSHKPPVVSKVESNENNEDQLQQDTQTYHSHSSHSSHSDAETEQLFKDFDKVLAEQKLKPKEPIETAVAEQISNNDGDSDGNGDDAGDIDGDADGRSDDDNESTAPHL